MKITKCLRSELIMTSVHDKGTKISPQVAVREIKVEDVWNEGEGEGGDRG